MNPNGAPKDRIRQVVGLYNQSILRLAFAYVRSIPDAEDIAQEVLLSYFQVAPAFLNAEHEKAWLLRCTINRCKNHLRSGWFKNRRPLPEQLSCLPQEQSGLLQEVLALDELYRMPLHLHYYEGYSIKEIAEILSEKPATIGTRLARGREQLRSRIGGMENV